MLRPNARIAAQPDLETALKHSPAVGIEMRELALNRLAHTNAQIDRSREREEEGRAAAAMAERLAALRARKQAAVAAEDYGAAAQLKADVAQLEAGLDEGLRSLSPLQSPLYEESLQVQQFQ